MFLLSLLTNKDAYNAQIIQCVNDTILKKKRFRVPGFRSGSRILEPVPWNRFLRQITSRDIVTAVGMLYVRLTSVVILHAIFVVVAEGSTEVKVGMYIIRIEAHDKVR